MYGAAPIGLCYFDAELRYVFINQWLADINGLSVEQHLGRRISEVLPDVAVGVEAQFRHVIETGEPILEGTVVAETPADLKVKRYFQHSYLPVTSDEGIVVGISCVVQDVTKRAQAEKELRLSSEIMENMAEGVCLVCAADGTIVFTNPRFEEIFGYEAEELVGRHSAILNAPGENTPEETAGAILQELEKIGIWSGDIRSIHKDRTPFWTHANVSTFEHPQHGIVRVAVVEDITERKRAEEELRANHNLLKAEERLLRRLLDVQEKERRMVAHDIHDGLLQDLIGAMLHLDSARDDLEARRAGANEMLAKSSTMISEAVSEGRRIIHDMRPMVLDERGVVEAIKHLIAREQYTATMTIDFVHDVQFERLDPQLEGTIYRIVQEALNNVKHHGRTDHATVTLSQNNGILNLDIRDDGIGFNLADVSLERFGLQGIRERARLFEGEAVIESSPGQGTVVRVELPVQSGT